MKKGNYPPVGGRSNGDLSAALAMKGKQFTFMLTTACLSTDHPVVLKEEEKTATPLLPLPEKANVNVKA